MRESISYTSAGESHGPAEVLTIRGLPAGFPLDIEALNRQLQRRQQGYGRGGRMRIEKDEVQILSGLRHGKSLASPLALLIWNLDHAQWQKEMDPLQGKVESKIRVPRPGHADHTGALKYGFDDIRNVLERASARETSARILAGAVCRQFLEALDIRLGSCVIRMGDVRCPDMQP
ncbi:MAG: chorismate synthase, partial [Candidatus Marinimicrobia bacterium]|nr:chorismate synthase [Candidatus Neomarinimicrobiota bacterium]